MYRVLIVDDEPDIRLGLQMKADWERLGLAAAGEAGNGVEALDQLEAGGIDIVITDMSMPVMNGVSFLEACKERFPALRIIVITGYEDFHYARAAVKSQARDYLLKPVARDELEAALQKVVAELDEERQSSSLKAALEWKLSQYYKEMKEHFILHVIKGERKPAQAVRERAKLFELDTWEELGVRFITVGIRERLTAEGAADGRTPEKLRLPFELICREFAEGCGQQVQHFHDAGYPGLMHFILPGTDADCADFVDRLRACVSGHLLLEPAIGAGQTAAGFNGWRDGYVSALLAWNLTDTKGSSDLKGNADDSGSLPEEVSGLLRKCLIKGDLAGFGGTVRKELSQAFGESRAHFVKTIFQLYLLVEAAAQESGTRLDDRNALWIRPELVLELHTAAKAEEFLSGIARRIRPLSREETGEADRPLIQAVQQFIDTHYMYDLTLTMLAERFSYHPSYFSELFKSKMGKTFIQYVTEVRMNQAVRLLEETSLSLWDIAELTGFANASYFSSKFKRQYGVSPSDYRQTRQYEKIESQQPKK
jgi:two-component system, response regulator YesN